MNADKINKLISQENEQREEQTLREARNIISEISRNQNKIAELNKQNTELRESLKKLEHTPLDAAVIIQG